MAYITTSATKKSPSPSRPTPIAVAIELNPKYADAYNNRGLEKSRLSQNEVSLTDLNRAIELKSNFASAYFNRGITKLDLNQKQSGIADLKKAAKLYRQQRKMKEYKNVIETIDLMK